MPPPLLSVVVTVYARQEYLRGALASLLAQTHEHLEVLVAEDGGPEVARDIVAELGDDRIRLLRSEENRGVVLSVKQAIAASRGEFVAILNDDDVWLPGLAERLLEPLLADYELVLAFSDHFILGPDGAIDPTATDENTARWGRDRLRPGRHQPFHDLALVRQALPAVMATLFRRSAMDWERLPREAGGHYDLYLAYLACRSGGAAYYVPERLSGYRVHPQMETVVGRGRNSAASVFCWDTFRRDPLLHAQRPELEGRFTHALGSRGLARLRSGERVAGRRDLLHAFARHPTLRAAVGLGLSYAPRRAAEVTFRALEVLPVHRWLRAHRALELR